jgi:ABC-2 type transport system permease protein
MIPLLKSEARKLLTVRSTYIASILGLLIIIFFAFWIEGYKGVSGSPAALLQKTALNEIIINSSLTSVIISIIAILFIGHEYRHNMIMYTLTAANSRLKVLIAKSVVVATYSAIYTLIGVGIAVASYYAGLALRDATLPAQDLDAVGRVLQLTFYGVAYGLIGLLLGTALRNIVGAIAFIFIVPGTVESLLALLLKDNAMYLPFTALERFVGSGMLPNGADLTYGKAFVISIGYLALGWALTAFFFARRDAN